jgi:sn-glycerol 3-phosphate transport system ATP-binding protein
MEVFEHPADTYVAGFIGAPAMNFLPAILTNTGTAAKLEAGPLLQFVDGQRKASDGKALTIGIRPEHIRMNAGGIPLRIDLIEPLGSETLVHGRLAAPGEAALVMRLAGRAPETDMLSVEFPVEDIHVFDAETGLRLS